MLPEGISNKECRMMKAIPLFEIRHSAFDIRYSLFVACIGQPVADIGQTVTKNGASGMYQLIGNGFINFSGAPKDAALHLQRWNSRWRHFHHATSSLPSFSMQLAYHAILRTAHPIHPRPICAPNL
jgi:hypothetical protein